MSKGSVKDVINYKRCNNDWLFEQRIVDTTHSKPFSKEEALRWNPTDKIQQALQNLKRNNLGRKKQSFNASLAGSYLGREIRPVVLGRHRAN